jgi:hypothetical protein
LSKLFDADRLRLREQAILRTNEQMVSTAVSIAMENYYAWNAK